VDIPLELFLEFNKMPDSKRVEISSEEYHLIISNPYAALHLTPEASVAQIEGARAANLKFHPDIAMHLPESEREATIKKFLTANVAYQEIMKRRKRSGAIIKEVDSFMGRDVDKVVYRNIAMEGEDVTFGGETDIYHLWIELEGEGGVAIYDTTYLGHLPGGFLCFGPNYDDPKRNQFEDGEVYGITIPVNTLFAYAERKKGNMIAPVLIRPLLSSFGLEGIVDETEFSRSLSEAEDPYDVIKQFDIEKHLKEGHSLNNPWCLEDFFINLCAITHMNVAGGKHICGIHIMDIDLTDDNLTLYHGEEVGLMIKRDYVGPILKAYEFYSQIGLPSKEQCAKTEFGPKDLQILRTLAYGPMLPERTSTREA